MRKTIGVVLTAMLLLAGCADKEPDTGFAGLPSASPSTSPAGPSPSASAEAQSTIDVTTTPDEITPEWVTAVVNTLLAEYGEMTAEILATPVTDDPTLPAGFDERLEELFAGEYLDLARVELEQTATTTETREAFLPSERFTGLRIEMIVVQVQQPSCVVAVGRVDRSGTLRAGGTSETLTAVSLSQTIGGAWTVRDMLANTDESGDANPDEFMLSADLGDYGKALDHTCEVKS